MATQYGDYIKALQRGFREYRNTHYGNRPELFKSYNEDGPVVWTDLSRDLNVMTPTCAPSLREMVVKKIPRSKRHRHFGSMQSSQALVQSTFGVIEAFDRLAVLANVRDEEGGHAFGPSAATGNLTFEKQITALGEDQRGPPLSMSGSGELIGSPLNASCPRQASEPVRDPDCALRTRNTAMAAMSIKAIEPSNDAH